MCFASKKPSEGEFFVPAGTDLAVNRLGVVWDQEGRKNTVLILFGRYVPMAETHSMCIVCSYMHRNY